MAWQAQPQWTAIHGNDISDHRWQSGYEEPGVYCRRSLDPWDHSTGQQGYEMRGYGSHQSFPVDEASIHTTSPFLQPDPTIRSDATSGKKGRGLTGWKAGVLSCAAIAGGVCLLNAGLTIWALYNHHVQNGIWYLYRGSCTRVATISLWVHLGINVMSTLLLSASNYTMQVISSPTRPEVDSAHGRSSWLDIGVPSIRNLFRLPAGRVLMWLILALSSIPLHLLYNTAVFSTLSANAYNYLVVTESFLTSAPQYGTTGSQVKVSQDVIAKINEQATRHALVRYEKAACQTAYSSTFVSKVRNVLLVSSDKNGINNVLGGRYASMNFNVDDIPFAWICGDPYQTNPGYQYDTAEMSGTCTPSIASTVTSNWKRLGYKIDYCMVEEVEEKCSMSFSLPIMITVITANLLKFLVMVLTILRVRNRPLVTIGDAIASFLEHPDSTTEGRCLQGKKELISSQKMTIAPRAWKTKKNFWFRAASKKRWFTCNFLCMLGVGIGGYFLIIGMQQIGATDLKTLYEMGYGSINVTSLVEIQFQGLLTTILVANLPQGILSFLYLTYNGLFTCVVGADEWSRFAHSRKSLRVTAPVGQQRTTYYLQLPYLYAIPLLIISGSLHWLMSQSLFLAMVNVYDDTGVYKSKLSINAVGYSCIGIITGMAVGSIAILGGILNGFRRYPAGIPLVGSCSAAISAACHPPKDDTDAHLKEVRWGVVGHGNGGVGHCSFTSFEVTDPIEGQLYAGKDFKQD